MPIRSAVLAALAICVTGAASGVAQAATPAPVAVTGAAANVTVNSAILNGKVDPRGEATSYFFQYGTTKAYGAQTTAGTAGNGSASVSATQAVVGLQAFTTYHYRLVAFSAGGTTDGTDRTFTTPKIPLNVQIASAPNPLTFGQPFQVTGTISGTNAATREVVLEANPYPYTGSFKAIGTPELADSSGNFAFPALGVAENTQLRVSTVGSPSVTSAVLLEGVAVRVSFHVRHTSRRGFVRLFGNVTPAETGALVGFQLMSSGRSVNEGGTSVKAAGASFSSFSRVIRLRHRGVYRALVRINDPARLSAYSGPVLVR